MTLFRSALVLLAGLAALWGCDNIIETPASLAGAYTLWGAFNPSVGTQLVRVVPVADTLLPTSADPLPVTVVSTDVATGVETVWRDSVVTFRNRSIGHIYRAAFRPEHGKTYRFAVRRADGTEVSATTTVPLRVNPFVGPANQTDGVRVPVVWPEAPQLNQVRVAYLVQDRTTCALYRLSVRLTPSSGTLEPAGAGSAVVLNLTRIAPVLRSLLDAGGDAPVLIGLRGVTLYAEVASADWRPPGGIFDFEALAAPEVFDNVDGGFGFVGAAYPDSFAFAPNPADLVRTTFVDTVPTCGALS